MDQAQLADLFEREMTPDTSPSNVAMPGVPAQEITVMGVDDREPAGFEDEGDIKMSDEEIDNILGMHIRNAVNWYGSEIATAQAKAMEYYLGLPQGDLAPPGVAGRSQAVDTTVSDIIEWMMPALMEMFFASGNVIDYEPRNPSDEKGAKQMTHTANYVINSQNPGFQVFLDWFKNALLNKLGVVKCFWEPTENHSREYFNQQTDVQLGLLVDDPDLEIIKITSYVDPHAERAEMDRFKQQSQAFGQWQQAAAQAKAQGLPWPPMQPPAPPQPGQPPQAAQPQPMQPPPRPAPINLQKLPQLHNVIARRAKKSGKVSIEAMNSEDFIVDPRSRRVEDGFSAHRLKRTIGYLRQQGYKNVDDISSDSDAESAENSEVQLARQSLQNTYVPPNATEDYGDESMREVWLYECYLPIDCDLDGIPEWRRITRAGDQILENVIVDGPPFATLCPVPIPGLLYGRSLADLGMMTQYSKTGLLRSLIDNVNVQVNGRTWAIESQVNISDLLTNRPGGVVRVKSANAVGMLQQGLADSQGAYQLLEFLDSQSQERTGVTKYTKGTDSDALNSTATGITNLTERADLRVKLVARCFAETGVKRLFMLIQKELAKHQDQNMVFKVNEDWVDVDPRTWHNEYILVPRVGLGSGDRSKKVQQLLQLMGVQSTAAQAGLTTPENLYNSACDLVDAIQLGKPQRYFTLPDPNAPKPPPPPDPNMVLVQGQLQIEHQKAQDKRETDQFQAQIDAQNDQRDFEHKQALEAAKLQNQREIEAERLAWEKEKFYAQLTADREIAALKAMATTQQEADMRRQTLADQNAAALRDAHVDSAHRDADRQHEAEQADAQRQHDAAQAEADRQAQIEIARQKAAQITPGTAE
jgi:hypothetical protein